MIRNYLTIAWRNMMRQKLYTLINIFGLASTATFILVIRYVQDEFSFDRWHTKGDRIYNVIRETRSGGKAIWNRGTSGGLAKAIEADIPEVEQVARVFMSWANFELEGRQFGMGVWAVDPSVFFDLFDYPFVRGSHETAFPNPSSIAITEGQAERLFGEEDPIGQTVSLTSNSIYGEFTVTAVLRNVPQNSTFGFGGIVTQPRGKLGLEAWDGWLSTYSHRPVQTYLLPQDGADLSTLEIKLSALIDRYMGPDIAKNNDYHLQALHDMHLYSREKSIGATGWDGRLGDISRVYQFVAIAVVVLAIACINFTNLTTARSARRAREVGLRKVSGAFRLHLIVQFLSESVITSLLALTLAIIFVKIALPDFNAYFNKQLELELLSEPTLVVQSLIIAIAVGFVAGVYPAFFLSAFQPNETLKGTFRTGSRGRWIRKALVSVQFAISITLLIGTGVIYQQIQYMKNKDLGYDAEQVVVVPILGADRNRPKEEARLADRYQVVKRALLEHPNALQATAYRYWIGWGAGGMRSVEPEGHHATDWRIQVMEIDEDYLGFFGVQMVSGRKFDPVTFPADTSRAFLLNEAAVKALRWDVEPGKKNSAIGKSFKWVDSERNRVGHVIGVVKDFHYGPLRERIGPIALILRKRQFISVALRLGTNDLEQTIDHFKTVWSRFVPATQGFQHYFIDQEFQYMYEEEHRVQSLTLFASGNAIALACMGLFGLASYAMQERRKEIGVRKTLGGSITGLIALVSREFIALVLVATVIATPVAWSIMRGWLDNFAYRADLEPLVFILGSAITLIIAQLTVTFHAYRAAQADPVIALRGGVVVSSQKATSGGFDRRLPAAGCRRCADKTFWV